MHKEQDKGSINLQTNAITGSLPLFVTLVFSVSYFAL
jgi:hypothetical protein